jgi:hypothetical protein
MFGLPVKSLGGVSRMQRHWSYTAVAVAALLIAPAAHAATKPAPAKAGSKPAAKPAAAAPVVASEPARAPGSFMVPKAVVMKPMTPAETEANAVWNVRAALNVAALQCQYSKYLATTPNYNAFLKHHADEIAKAQATMIAHFKRYEGAKANAAFDTYLTKTYNSFSTLDAQYQFCEAAGIVGREVLAIPKGKLGAEAMRRGPQIRASFAQMPLAPSLTVMEIQPINLAPIAAPGA